jgi:hypothetical protein
MPGFPNPCPPNRTNSNNLGTRGTHRDERRGERAGVNSRPPRSVRSSVSAQEHFVHVTPRPIFARLKRSNDRMGGGVKMFRGVAIRRRVAATDMSAGKAKPQVDPGRTDLQTILAPVRARDDVGIDLIEVGASCVHDSTFVDFLFISTIAASLRKRLKPPAGAWGRLLPPALARERLQLTCFSAGRREFFSTTSDQTGRRDRATRRRASRFADAGEDQASGYDPAHSH